MKAVIQTNMETHEEYQYLLALCKIIETGRKKPNRTGVPTLSLTGLQFRFTLMRGPDRILPLITTKYTNFRLILSELLWFISGNTNSETLRTVYQNNIWNANGSREFLDSRGFTDRDVGNLGPVYGFQWRHWNGDYQDPTGKPGIDQLANVINSIQADPFGRRHIVSAWNPEQIADMALPPCHVLFQFIVQPDSSGNPSHLDCLLYQRSGDMPLGVPFNIASYSLLCHIVAKLTSLTPGEFIITIGDAHIYENQIELCKTQIQRKTYEFPVLNISNITDINTLNMSDFTLVNYKNHPVIKYPFTA